MKKIIMYASLVLIFALITFIGFMFIIAIDEVINIENSIIMEWFPDDSEIAGWGVFWMLIAGISLLIEMILILFEVKLIKKIRKLSNPKSLKLK